MTYCAIYDIIVTGKEGEFLRAYEKYANIFGIKAPKHPDIEFTTNNGVEFILRWNKNE